MRLIVVIGRVRFAGRHQPEADADGFRLRDAERFQGIERLVEKYTRGFWALSLLHGIGKPFEDLALLVALPDLVGQAESFLIAFNGRIMVTLAPDSVRYPPEGDHLPEGILGEYFQRFLGSPESIPVESLVQLHLPEIAEHSRFAATITDTLVDAEGRMQVFKGPWISSQMAEGDSDMAERAARRGLARLPLSAATALHEH